VTTAAAGEVEGLRRPALSAGPDMAPLHLRLGLLQILRATLATISATVAFVLPGLSAGRLPALAGFSVAYVVVSTGLDLARQRHAPGVPALVGGLVLFDGAYLAVVMSLTGGPQSPLSFLILAHVIGVTLLLSFRNGLKAALWHALLLFFTSWMAQAGLVGVGPGLTPVQSAAFGAVALLVVAVTTAWFSSMNEGELRRGKAELRALAEMAGRIAAHQDRSGLVEALLGGVADAFPGQRCALVLADPAGSTVSAYVLGATGSVETVASRPAAPAAERPPAGSRTYEQVESRPRLLAALDPSREPLLAAALPHSSNVMVAPLVVDAQPVGALALVWGGGRRARVTVRTVDLVAQFAAHAALALRAAMLQAELERSARTDALTGLANRRCFEEALHRELAVATRSGAPCGLIVLDVDHFKAVNDAHGHQTGDEVLAGVGSALGRAARDTDIVTRYGGEEFAVVLPGCSAAEATEAAERLRAAVASSASPVPVTLSAGVAAFPSDAEDAVSLVAAADGALYKAKRQGRDRAVRYRRPRAARAMAAS